MTEDALKNLFDRARWTACGRLEETVKAVEEKYLDAFALSDDELDVWAAGVPASYLKHNDDDDGKK